MIGFSTTTAFRLVRRLAAAGQNTPSLYFLMCNISDIGAIEEDLGGRLPMDQFETAVSKAGAPTVTLIVLDHWKPQVLSVLDRNIVLFTRSGTLLLLATPEIGERALAAAPNLRNRLTDILRMEPDKALQGLRT